MHETGRRKAFGKIVFSLHKIQELFTMGTLQSVRKERFETQTISYIETV
jgi:hypothetical protein